MEKEEKDYSFIIETSNKQKIRVFFFLIIFLIIILGLTFAVFTTFKDGNKDSSSFQSIKNLIKEEISSLTPAGLFYSGFGTGLFFGPLFPEFFFFLSISKGNSILLSLLMVYSGFLTAQVANYFIGRKLSKPIMYFISKKKLYKARRFINRRGSLGVFLFNLLPLPAPLLTFALGITKYNVYRLFFFMILGNLLKYAAIIGFFILIYSN